MVWIPERKVLTRQPTVGLHQSIQGIFVGFNGAESNVAVTKNNITNSVYKEGQSASFNGSSSYVDLGNVSYRNIQTGAFTVVFTYSPSIIDANPKGLVHKRNIAGTATDSTLEFQIVQTANGNSIQFSGWNASSAVAFDCYATLPISVNNIYNVVAVYNGVNKPAIIAVNGIYGSATPATAVRSATTALQIGARVTGNDSRWFNGKIGYVAVLPCAIENPVELSQNPWQLFAPTKKYFPFVSSDTPKVWIPPRIRSHKFITNPLFSYSPGLLKEEVNGSSYAVIRDTNTKLIGNAVYTPGNATTNGLNLGTGALLGPLQESTIFAIVSTNAGLVNSLGTSSDGLISNNGNSIYCERASSGVDEIYKIGLIYSLANGLRAEFVYRNSASILLQQQVVCTGYNDGSLFLVWGRKKGTSHSVGICKLENPSAMSSSTGTFGSSSSAFSNPNIQRLISNDTLDSVASWNGFVYKVLGVNRALSDEEIRYLAQNSQKLFAPRKTLFPVGPSSVLDYTLYINSLIQSQELSMFDLIQQNILQLNDLLQPQQIDNVDVSLQGLLQINNLIQSQIHSSTELLQQNILSVNYLNQTQTLKQVDLISQNILSLQNIIQQQYTNSVSILQQNILSVNNIRQLQTLINTTLTQQNVLSTNPITTIQNLSNVLLNQNSSLSINSITQTQLIDKLNLIQSNILAINNVTQSQTILNTLLTQQNNLLVNSLNQLHAISDAPLSQGSFLLLQNLIHNQFLTNTTLTQQNILSVNNTRQLQSILQALLTQQNILNSNSITQTQTLDKAVFNQGSSLTINPINQTQSETSSSLIQQGILLINNIRQVQSLIDTTLTQQNTLTLSSIFQNQQINSTFLDQSTNLIVSNIRQIQSLSNVLLLQQNIVSVGNLLSNQILDNLNLGQSNVLNINSIIQNETIGNTKLDFSVLVSVNNLHQNINLSNISLLQSYILQAHGLLTQEKLNSPDLSQNHILIINDILHQQLLHNIDFNFLSNKILGKIISVLLPTDTIVTIISSGSEISIEKNQDIIQLS